MNNKEWKDTKNIACTEKKKKNRYEEYEEILFYLISQ